MMLEAVKWVLIGCLVLQLARVNEAYKYQPWSRPGDIKFLVIAGIHGNGRGGCNERSTKCGEMSTSKFPLLVALDWILDIINGVTSGLAPYLANITIGMHMCCHMTNPTIWASDKVRHKPVCTATEES